MVVRKKLPGGMAGFMFTALVACVGCPGASEQDMAFPRHGYGLLMGQGTSF